MCVNVLLFGPITADMLVRDGQCQPGVNCKTPVPVGARHGDKLARGGSTVKSD